MTHTTQHEFRGSNRTPKAVKLRAAQFDAHTWKLGISARTQLNYGLSGDQTRRHFAKQTRPHVATEYVEARRIGDEKVGEELTRNLRPHLRERVIHPKPKEEK
jgi:hypothetical protein